MSSGTKTPSDSQPAGPEASAKGADSGADRHPDARQARLAQALRDNLKKRKAQQRERKDGQRERKDGQRERKDGQRERKDGGRGEGGS